MATAFGRSRSDKADFADWNAKQPSPPALQRRLIAIVPLITSIV
jgi:hypothetical protein